MANIIKKVKNCEGCRRRREKMQQLWREMKERARQKKL